MTDAEREVYATLRNFLRALVRRLGVLAPADVKRAARDLETALNAVLGEPS